MKVIKWLRKWWPVIFITGLSIGAIASNVKGESLAVGGCITYVGGTASTCYTVTTEQLNTYTDWLN